MAIDNLSNSIITNLPLELIKRFEFLITIFQAVGWMVLIYLVFNIINMVINRKKKKQLEQLAKDVKEIKKILGKKKK